MNITDTVSPEATGDRLEMIFNRQRELHNKYKGIEEENKCGWGILQGKPFNLEQAQSQAYVKDLCWRVTEELAEAMEANSHDEDQHTKEEVVDALHFLIELFCVLNQDPQKLPYDYLGPDMLYKIMGPDREKELEMFDQCCLKTITFLGLACNCLKNKPWKQTQMQTDIKKFDVNLREACIGLFDCFKCLGMNDEDVFDIYFRKSEVNKFRIRSQY